MLLFYIVEEIDDILKPTRKKGVNSSGKGKRVERLLAKVLNDKFGGGFSRSVGSGNRWGQVSQLPKHAQDVFEGDLVAPANFILTLECKGGYDHIDLNSIFESGNSEVDSFLKQAEDQGNRTGKKPLLVWKKDRKPWLAFVKTKDLPTIEWEFCLTYRNWSAVSFEKLLNCDRSFFFRD